MKRKKNEIFSSHDISIELGWGEEVWAVTRGLIENTIDIPPTGAGSTGAFSVDTQPISCLPTPDWQPRHLITQECLEAARVNPLNANQKQNKNCQLWKNDKNK